MLGQGNMSVSDVVLLEKEFDVLCLKYGHSFPLFKYILFRTFALINKHISEHIHESHDKFFNKYIQLLVHIANAFKFQQEAVQDILQILSDIISLEKRVKTKELAVLIFKFRYTYYRYKSIKKRLRLEGKEDEELPGLVIAHELPHIFSACMSLTHLHPDDVNQARDMITELINETFILAHKYPKIKPNLDLFNSDLITHFNWLLKKLNAKAFADRYGPKPNIHSANRPSAKVKRAHNPRSSSRRKTMDEHGKK